MKETRLSVSIEDEELVIRIGVATLAHAGSHCPLFYHPETNPSPPYIKITNPERFAVEVANELFSEEEDGSSLISTTIDQAIEIAYESGSLAIEY